MNDGYSKIQLPMVSQDPTDPDFVQNPYLFYKVARSLGDFVFWEDYQMVVATTHVAVSTMLRHPNLGRESPANQQPDARHRLEPFYELEKDSLLQLEPPEHSRLRRIVMQGFGRPRLAAMAPQISQISDHLIDEFPEGEFDLVKAFTKPFPALVITRFVGVPDGMASQLQDWSNAMVAMYQARKDEAIEDAAAAAATEFGCYLGELIKERRRAPGKDFLSFLIAMKAEGELISDRELISTIVLMLNAGHEASVQAIGNAVAIIADHRDRSLMLRPTNLADTVDECLRFDPPLHMFTRHVYEAVDILGHRFEKGAEVGCLLGSASSDDSVWPDAEKFDPFRARRTHLSFGSGIHVCIGASLARLEMQIALPALFSRCPKLRITEPPEFANQYHFHGFKRLMVTVK